MLKASGKFNNEHVTPDLMKNFQNEIIVDQKLYSHAVHQFSQKKKKKNQLKLSNISHKNIGLLGSDGFNITMIKIGQINTSFLIISSIRIIPL